MTSSLSV